jgi:Restriction endonuclease ThaI
MLQKLFEAPRFVKTVQMYLPELFFIAEQQSSRNGKIGMEVGTFREQILTALLMT